MNVRALLAVVAAALPVAGASDPSFEVPELPQLEFDGFAPEGSG